MTRWRGATANLLLPLVIVLAAAPAIAQLPNGGFENGDLGGWTAGGGGAVEALQAPT